MAATRLVDVVTRTNSNSNSVNQALSIRSASMNRYEKLQSILQQMHELLVKHDQGQQKATFAAISAIESGDRETIIKSLNGLEFWGAAGSVIDTVLTEIPWTPAFRRDVTDDNRLTLLELELLQEMSKLGIAKPNVLLRERDLRWIARVNGLDI